MTTEVSFELNMDKALDKFFISVIGRGPSYSKNEYGKIVKGFTPNLTGAEKTALNTAFPDILKKIYDIDVVDF